MSTALLQLGLVAEEVEKVNPALVARDADGKAYTVRYEAVNAMLLNEFLKEHCKVEKLEATVESVAATVKGQAAQIQKVSAQLETSKPAPQVVKIPKAAPTSIKQQHFAISRHASPRGGFLFHALHGSLELAAYSCVSNLL